MYLHFNESLYQNGFVWEFECFLSGFNEFTT